MNVVHRLLRLRQTLNVRQIPMAGRIARVSRAEAEEVMTCAGLLGLLPSDPAEASAAFDGKYRLLGFLLFLREDCHAHQS